MNHSYEMSGSGFRLRPVSNRDASFILELRRDPLLSKYIHQTPPELGEQLKWLEAYYSRENDYYFVVESIKNNSAEGVISLYNINQSLRNAEWGRWILKDKSLAAIESCILLYQFAFDCLELKEVYSLTNAFNHRVVSFHDSCGITRKELLHDYFTLSGNKIDAIKHNLSRSEWDKIKNNLLPLAHAIANKVNNSSH